MFKSNLHAKKLNKERGLDLNNHRLPRQYQELSLIHPNLQVGAQGPQLPKPFSMVFVTLIPQEGARARETIEMVMGSSCYQSPNLKVGVNEK
jgi:hypothetical protein